MKKNAIALCALTWLACSCSTSHDNVVIDEVLVRGGTTTIGNDVDCSPYDATIPSLYVAKFECNWEACVQAFNHGLDKKYIAIRDEQIIPLVGLFPQYNNVIVVFDVRGVHLRR
jgi:hypothetical protein